MIWGQVRLALSKGNTKRAKELINKYEYLSKRSGVSESEIEKNIAYLYEEVNSTDKADEHYRQALALEPDNARWLNNLAYFLINKNRNVNEGLELVDKALEIDPENYLYLDTKGWGLYKQGKYKEALELLGKSWDLSPSYTPPIYLHLQEVKKAIASQKKN